jgi:hypothetical protein
MWSNCAHLGRISTHSEVSVVRSGRMEFLRSMPLYMEVATANVTSAERFMFSPRGLCSTPDTRATFGCPSSVFSAESSSALGGHAIQATFDTRLFFPVLVNVAVGINLFLYAVCQIIIIGWDLEIPAFMSLLGSRLASWLEGLPSVVRSAVMFVLTTLLGYDVCFICF